MAFRDSFSKTSFDRSLIILCTFFIFQSQAKEQQIKQPRTLYKLKVGDTLTYTPINYSLTLKSFTKHESKCAVPGKNCGSGYFPGVQIYPEFEVKSQNSCDTAPLAEECEFTHRVKSSDNATFVMVEFLSVFDICSEDSNRDNRNSCILNAVKNGPYKPALNPENCERISEPLEARDLCFEAAADDLQDAKVCEKMKGPQGFQCVLLRAKNAKDPKICRSLKKNRFHSSEAALQSQIEACLGAVGSGQ